MGTELAGPEGEVAAGGFPKDPVSNNLYFCAHLRFPGRSGGAYWAASL
jgi:hypothetical protein